MKRSSVYEWLLVGVVLGSMAACDGGGPGNRWEVGSGFDVGETSADATTETTGGGADTIPDGASAGCDAPTVVDSDVETATTWGDGCYEVDGRIDIEARLRIEPGTVVRFRENAGLSVRDSGMLVAEGASDARIKFIGTEANRGWWRSLAFAGSERNNVLDHVIVEHAGSGDPGYRPMAGVEPGALIVGQRGAPSSVRVTNSVVRKNDGNGIYIHAEGDLSEFDENRFHDNDVPLNIKADDIAQIGDSSRYREHSEYVIVVRGGEIEENATWPGTYIPWRVESEIVISDGETTIEAGVEVEFAEGTRFVVRNQGGIIADGNSGDRIRLTATNEQPGGWKGVFVRNSTHPANVLDHVVIEHAGQQHQGTRKKHGLEPAGLTVGQRGEEAAVAVTNSAFRDNAGHGMFVHKKGKFREFSSNKFHDNHGPPFSIRARHIDAIDEDSIRDASVVGVIRGGEIESDTRWGYPYGHWVVESDIVISDGDTTIAPGVKVQFAEGTRLVVRNQGAIIAHGNDNDWIRLSGTNEQAGWWKGLFVRDSTGSENVLDHVIIEHAGQQHQGTRKKHGLEPAGLTVGQRGEEAAVAVRNCSFLDNAGHGLFMHEKGNFHEFSSNKFKDNDVSLSIRARHIDAIDESNLGADRAGIIRGGKIESDTNWGYPYAPWRVESDIVISRGDTTIEPGVEVQFAEGTSLVVRNLGGIVADGNDGDWIRFSAVNEQAGGWKGIFIRNSTNPANVLDHVTLEYAGQKHQGTRQRHGLEPAGLTVGQRGDEAEVSVTNSRFRSNDGWGVFVHPDSSVNSDICSANTFESNPNDCKVKKD